jgi:excinuclease ABC subunit C
MGIYMLKGQDGQVIYVSKARNLKEKMKDYSVDTNNAAQDLLLDNIFSFEIIETTDEKKTYQLEKKLIEEYNPKFNIKIKSATSYPYVEFCTKQEKPLLKLAKTRKKKSSIYFGPVKTNQFGHQVVFLLNKIIDSEYGNNATPDEFKTICDDFFSGENKIVNKLIDKYGNEDDVKIVKL